MKKMILLLGLATFSFQLCAGLVLADKGASGYVIVIPDQAASPDARTAVDLQKYLNAITGVKIPVLKESWRRGNKALISVGPTRLARKKSPSVRNPGVRKWWLKPSARI